MSELLQLEPIGRRKSGIQEDAKSSLFDFVNFNQRGSGSSAKKQRSTPRLSFTSKRRRAIYDDEEESSPELAQPSVLPRKQKENKNSSKSKDKSEGNAEKVTPRLKQTPRSRKKSSSTKRSLKSTNLKTPQSDKAEVNRTVEKTAINGENGNHNTPSSPRKSNRLRRPTKIGFYYDEDDDEVSTKNTSFTSPSPPVKLSKSESRASSRAVNLTSPIASPRKKSSRAATTSVTANQIEVHEDDEDASTNAPSSNSPPAKVIKSSSRKVFCPRKKIASGGAARVTPRRVAANEIEVLEEVPADKRVNGSFQHVMPAESTPDKSGSGSEGMEAMFVIEENGEDYRDLRNADLTKNMVLVPVEMTENVAGSMEPKFGTEHTNAEYPGIFRTTSHDLTETVGVGYLKIEARTIKPPEVCDDGKILYWIIKGTITVKSCGGYYQPNQRAVHNYLFGKALGPGACIVIPRKTVYTLENWGSQDAILSYCIISQSHP